MVGGKGRKYRLIIFIIKHVAKSSNITVFIYQSGSGCHGNPAHRMATHLAGLPRQLSPTTCLISFGELMPNEAPDVPLIRSLAPQTNQTTH